MTIECLDHVVSGVAYDFMAWLMSEKSRLLLSADNHKDPYATFAAADAVKEFLELRGVEDCEPLRSWQSRLAKNTHTKPLDPDQEPVPEPIGPPKR